MAKKLTRAFYAYPAGPVDLRTTIESAARAASSSASGLDVRVWPALDIVGAHIGDSVRSEISSSKFLVADVTTKNPNVYYEIGYAIGRGIPILPTVNRSHADAQRRVQSDGYFDNIKFQSYDNFESLRDILISFHGTTLLDIYSRDINYTQPLYILDTTVKTDFRNRIVSTIKDARVFFRAFDPVETPRFSTVKIISEATSSVAAVIPFLASHIEDAATHNLRASFLAGLMHGLGKPTLLVQNGDGPVPADYRDDIETPADLNRLSELVEKFSTSALRELQGRPKQRRRESRTPVQDLWLGASAAENEFRVLDQYFLETSEYIRTIKGDGKIVVGRKGSGKTAIFFMARDYFRRGRGNVVVDLKPESHELVELRELLASFMSAGLASHTLAGFWYVLILIEVALKLSVSLSARADRERTAFLLARDIDAELEKFGIPAKADFTARLKMFAERLTSSIRYEMESGRQLNVDQITNFVFGPDQRSLRQAISRSVGDGRTVSVLFDNLDKGWPAGGVRGEDVILIRTLIDSLNHLQRDLSSDDVDFRFSVFLRNDVYELLIENTSDRGKEAAIPIDWSDREKLKVVIQKRIAASIDAPRGKLDSWGTYFPTKVGDEDALDYVIDHCLMRPRFLIDIIESSISFAINRQHSSVNQRDLQDAIKQHSYYLVDDFGYEIRDATGLTHQVIDAFLGCGRVMPEQEVLQRVASFQSPAADAERIVELLVWYGFLGLLIEKREKYIYDFNYSMRRMNAEAKRQNFAVTYVLNPAFYVGLSP